MTLSAQESIVVGTLSSIVEDGRGEEMVPVEASALLSLWQDRLTLRLFEQRIKDDRLWTAASAYAKTYEGPWGLKASSEDALLSVINALYPNFPQHAPGIYAIRESPQLTALADFIYDECESEGMLPKAIVERVLPKLDEIMAGAEL